MIRLLGVLMVGAVFALGCQQVETEEQPTAVTESTSLAEEELTAVGSECGKAHAGCPRADNDGCPYAKKAGCECEGKEPSEPGPCGAKEAPCEECKSKGGCPHASADEDGEPCPCKRGKTCPHAGT